MLKKEEFPKGCQSLHLLNKRRKIWQSKKIIKTLYHKWYRTIKANLNPGLILEIGGGSGNLKEFLPHVISSDRLLVPWLDAVLDAHDLPVKDESLDNIVLFDVLHHLMEPVQFFSEAQRVLKQNGRIILMEPYIAWASFLIYKFLHSEGLSWNVDPFKTKFSKKDKNHFNGNQAIPTLMFEKYINRFAANFPGLKIIKQERIDFVVYPLSGGFHNPSLCPQFLYPALEYLEKLLYPLNRFLAFRIFVVIIKT
ncbi:MAG: class I SAM-dependent methyltransferase [Desulfobacterales bacterium]|uniref:Class I SAM-dependent methyltransferase n=1 Tax=Candidatus Desulfatibia vada TaxID=2841696 RepID=A0A8J6P2I4_9BACT|nr:class I SAM-dependent methyltransferase [Candidatus Desulfatibia vada]